MEYYEMRSDCTIMWNFLLFKYIYVSRKFLAGLQPRWCSLVILCFRIIVLKPFFTDLPPVIPRGRLGWGGWQGEGMKKRWRGKHKIISSPWERGGDGGFAVFERAWTLQTTPDFSPTPPPAPQRRLQLSTSFPFKGGGDALPSTWITRSGYNWRCAATTGPCTKPGTQSLNIAERCFPLSTPLP